MTVTEVSKAEASPQGQDILPFTSTGPLHLPPLQVVSLNSQFLLKLQGIKTSREENLLKIGDGLLKALCPDGVHRAVR